MMEDLGFLLVLSTTIGLPYDLVLEIFHTLSKLKTFQAGPVRGGGAQGSLSHHPDHKEMPQPPPRQYGDSCTCQQVEDSTSLSQ